MKSYKKMIREIKDRIGEEAEKLLDDKDGNDQERDLNRIEAIGLTKALKLINAVEAEFENE